MDEAMWRSILVACGRCGHAQTRKIAIAIFEIIRRSGVTINALTYGQYTKALAEQDALQLRVDGRDEIDDCPWLEEKGQNWYMATCEAGPPETMARSRSVADSLRDMLSTQRIRLGSTTKDKNGQPGEKKPPQPTPEGEVWTSLLRDPKSSSYNTTLSGLKMDSGGVVGLSLFCICTNPDCQYMPLDEEIMTLRQDLLLVSDEHHGNLLLCPKCDNRITPKLYYEAKTFKGYVKPVIARSNSSEPETPVPSLVRRISVSGSIVMPLNSRSTSRAGPTFFGTVGDSPLKRGLSTSGVGSYERHNRPEALQGEVSGLGLGGSSSGYVDYISPFTLRMRMERLLLEHGEESLTREWAREHHPEIYWNLVWYCTRLSVPFPLLLETLELQPAVDAPQPPNSDGNSYSRARGYSRRDSIEQTHDFFHEVVVVGLEDRVVRARCKRVMDVLMTRGNIVPPDGAPTATVVPTNSPPTSTIALFSTSPPPDSLMSVKSQLDILGPLTIAEVFPNVSQSELDAMQDVGGIIIRKGVPGLKEAVVKFLYYRASFSGWTSEAALGSMYRVFAKLAAHLRVKKLPVVASLQNIAERPLFEQEYAAAINKLTERQLRDQAEKTIVELMAELPSRDALKFRSVFGQLF